MAERPHLVLVLQGGGARAAYQVGVYEALSESGFDIDWVFGVSTGALNAAVIAGSAPDERVARLRAMWRSFRTVLDPAAIWPEPFATFGRMALTGAAGLGRRGLYRVRMPSGAFGAPGSASATSLYSLAPLRRTLTRYVDFDRIEGGEPRLSLGAVDVESGRMRFFDSAREAVGVEEIVASAAMPPAAPPVRIGDRWYWDGSLVGGALTGLLDAVLRGDGGRRGVVALLVDVNPDVPRAPRDLVDAVARRDELTEGARGDLQLSRFLARAASRVAGSGPLELPDVAANPAPRGPVGIVRLTHGDEADLGPLGAFDFTPTALQRRIDAGREHTLAALAHTAVDFDLFGADAEPDLFVHTLRDGELVLSQRRSVSQSEGGAEDPLEPVDAVSLRMAAVPGPEAEEVDAQPQDADQTRSWTNIRAIRLEKTDDSVP